MSSSSTVTKVELVTEAVEALVLASVIAATNHVDSERLIHHENVVDARKVLSAALTELVKPTLRVIDNAA